MMPRDDQGVAGTNREQVENDDGDVILVECGGRCLPGDDLAENTLVVVTQGCLSRGINCSPDMTGNTPFEPATTLSRPTVQSCCGDAGESSTTAARRLSSHQRAATISTATTVASNSVRPPRRRSPSSRRKPSNRVTSHAGARRS